MSGIARRGFGAVTVLYDSLGFAGTPDAAFDAPRAAGAALLSFNPVNPFAARGGWRPNRRDHRKILVADGRVAVMGGVNLDPVYENSCRRARLGRPAPVEDPDDACWADMALQAEGAAAALQGGPALPARNWFPAAGQPGNATMRVVGSAPGHDEVDAVALGPEAGAAVEASMARARPVSLAQWRRRGIGQRLKEVLAAPVLDLL